MVERSDRAPLLDWEEIPPAEKPHPTPEQEKDSESSPSNSRALGCIAPGIGWSTSPGGPGSSTTNTSSKDTDTATAHSTTTVLTPPGCEAQCPEKDDQTTDTGQAGLPHDISMVKWEEEDQIVAVFVVTFDTRSGNMLEWCLPQDIDLDGVEFKAMASGSHRVTSDFIYFRKGCYFGLACFANMAVESEVERGARMKSVGILSPSYTLLYRYMGFLEHQVSQPFAIGNDLMHTGGVTLQSVTHPAIYVLSDKVIALQGDCCSVLVRKDCTRLHQAVPSPSLCQQSLRLQLKSPGQYSPLEAFYEDKRAVLPPGGEGIVTACPASAWGASLNHCMHPEMKITHPAGCMSQFIQFFGEQIMVLWKLALLRRRILIFSPPPVGVVCYRVYCCCCLANVSIPGVGVAVPEFRPFFYVNVADISTLENELAYVACTTEKIFEEKKDLYDVYVDNQNVKSYREGLKPLLRLSATDKEKYRKLTEQRQMLLYSQEENGDCVSSEEDLFILFFLEQNNRIFQTLSEVAGSPEPTLTQETVRAMGLDPHGDRLFLLHLLETYGYDTLLITDHPCCS